LTVNLPAGASQRWLFVNATIGAFAMSVQTPSNLASVAVPQGGFASPTGVYGIGDGNIYPSVAPLSVPISQAPSPLSLVERTNTGAVLATVFNSSEAATNPAITNVYVDDGTGNLLKISLANLVAQLPAQGLPQIRAAQASMVNGANRVNFATPFPASCVSVALTPNGATATFAVTAFDRFGFNANVGVTESYTYIAAGN